MAGSTSPAACNSKKIREISTELHAVIHMLLATGYKDVYSPVRSIKRQSIHLLKGLSAESSNCLQRRLHFAIPLGELIIEFKIMSF